MALETCGRRPLLVCYGQTAHALFNHRLPDATAINTGLDHSQHGRSITGSELFTMENTAKCQHRKIRPVPARTVTACTLVYRLHNGYVRGDVFIEHIFYGMECTSKLLEPHLTDGPTSVGSEGLIIKEKHREHS